MAAITKIVRNESGSTITLGGVVLNDGDSYTVPKTQYTEWSINSKIIDLIRANDLVVNDGNSDLPSNLAEEHIIAGVVSIHEDIALLPGVGVDAPALTAIDSASTGFEMEIDDKIYGQTRIDGLVGDTVEIQIHYTIDNNTTDKYIEFDLTYFTTNGSNDNKNIQNDTFTVVMGPEEVESTPWLVREISVDLPATAFQNGETYLYFGLVRKNPSEDSPTNNPIILRYCKRYYKVDN
jgi:hypothetical protein